LTNGTRTTNKNDLQCQDICLIIEKCSAHGVTTLKFGSLEVSFNPVPKQNKPGAEISAETHDKLNEEANLKDEVDLREEQIANAQVEDPLLAEQLILDGELDDESDSDDDSNG
jgi:hypothetical protein